MQASDGTTTKLAEQLQAVWSHVIRASGGGFLQELERQELSLTQMKALHVLQAGPDKTVKQLAETLGLSLPAASRAVEGLVQRDLVERFESPGDRRCRPVRISDGGRAVLARVAEARLAGLAAFAGSLPPHERDLLAAALVPIVERISP